MIKGFIPPTVKRSERGSVHRCPQCGDHLRRLGQPNMKTHEIVEKGYACQNPKCAGKVFLPVDRNGLTAFEAAPALTVTPALAKRVAALKAATKERTGIVAAEKTIKEIEEP